MSTKLQRGTKRTCQNAACDLPFYDLNRTVFACPNCGANFDMQVLADAEARLQARAPQRRYARTFAPQAVAADPLPIEATDLDGAEDEVADDAAGTADSDVILETEDDSDDTSAIGDIPSTATDE